MKGDFLSRLAKYGRSLIDVWGTYPKMIHFYRINAVHPCLRLR